MIQDDEIKCLTPEGEINTSDCCVHFSVPPSTWWRDVRFACGTIQFFASKQEAQEWPRKRGFHAGDIISLDTAWELSKVRSLRVHDLAWAIEDSELTWMKAWYHDKHEHGYNRKTAAEVEELYTRLGMTAGFWKA